MDRAMMALSLEEEEEDVPFSMPTDPEYSSLEVNKLSLMGRTLNPECQIMSQLIYKMPRKWQKEGRVRGVALSNERFQFIFDNEHDLLDVLEKGVQTFNEWVIVLERWMENPPDDYLQFIPLWVQISKIPVNFYNKKALTELGDIIGEVKIVAFGPSKPITQPFVRVQVRFNVAKPLRTAKVIDLGQGKSTTIHFHYENVQKRCYTCFRLNHEKQICPLEVRKRQEVAAARRTKIQQELSMKDKVLKESDPLFGVLLESQVCINPANGRPRIDEEVLEEMRRYLTTDTGEDQTLKIDKVIRSVKEVEKDPVAQKLALRLEAPPVFISDINKNKGRVFDYGAKLAEDENQMIPFKPEKLMAAAFKGQGSLSWQENFRAGGSESCDSGGKEWASEYPSVFQSGFYSSGSSGIQKRVPKPRRRPSKAVRKARKESLSAEELEKLERQREGKQMEGSKKRKCVNREEGRETTSKVSCLEMVPSEGLSKV